MKNRLPDHAVLYLDGRDLTFDSVTDRVTATVGGGAASVRFESKVGNLSVFVSSPACGVRWLRLRWRFALRPRVKIFGDVWERSYGDLRWDTVRADRAMPWYMAVSDGSDTDPDPTGRLTECFGLMVGCASLCFWQCDGEGVTLWMDLRNGGSPTLLGERELCCGTVLFREYADMSAYRAMQAFCREMSPTIDRTDHVVYGSNNWYYAYGKSSAEDILSDTRFVSEACAGLENRPYMVIDDGWEPRTCTTPWVGSEKFPDMPGLAAGMRSLGVRPGIWVRPLIDGDGQDARVLGLPDECYLTWRPNTLDPSHPLVKEYVADLMKRLAGWGYELIKHDYSTFDIFGAWGIQLRDRLTPDGWCFHDRTRTSAEIIVDFYKTIREAVPGVVIIGCNTIGHLCAGLCQLNRTGDDTSGRDWQRTVTNGVNTVAGRLCQHGAFYASDGDCVGIMGLIDWAYNRRWLKLLSCSGTPLFVSCKPGILGEDAMNDLREAFRRASTANDDLIPLDWMETPVPRRWLINGEETVFDWYPPEGAQTFRP